MEMVDSMYFSQSWAVHVPLAVDSTIMGHTSVWNITGIVIVGAERAVVVVGTTFVLCILVYLCLLAASFPSRVAAGGRRLHPGINTSGVACMLILPLTIYSEISPNISGRATT